MALTLVPVPFWLTIIALLLLFLSVLVFFSELREFSSFAMLLWKICFTEATLSNNRNIPGSFLKTWAAVRRFVEKSLFELLLLLLFVFVDVETIRFVVFFPIIDFLLVIVSVFLWLFEVDELPWTMLLLLILFPKVGREEGGGKRIWWGEWSTRKLLWIHSSKNEADTIVRCSWKAFFLTVFEEQMIDRINYVSKKQRKTLTKKSFVSFWKQSLWAPRNNRSLWG